MATLKASCTASGDGSGAQLTATAYAEITGGVFEAGVFEPGVFQTGYENAASLVAEGEVDASTHYQVQPSQGTTRTQRVRWKVTIDGVEVENVLPSISASRSLDRSMQQASVSLWAPDVTETVGRMPYMGIPATGLQRITIALEYETDDGTRFAEPIITDGIASSSNRSVSYVNGITDEYGVVDEHAVWVDVPVTYQLPAGHNKARRQVIREILQEAGVDNIAISGLSKRMLKAVDIASGDWLSLINALAEVEGARISRSRTNESVTVYDAPERERPPVMRWTFGPDDIVVASGSQQYPVTIQPSEQAATRLSFRGAEQVTRDQDCGLSTETFLGEGRSDARIAALGWEQSFHASVETIAASGASDLPEIEPPRLVSEFVTRITTDCGDVVLEEQETFGLHLRKSYRWRHNGGLADAPINLYNGCYLEEDASGDGQAQAYESPLPRWMQKAKNTTARAYDDDGYLTTETDETQSLYQRREAIKSRTDAGDPWDAATGPATWYNDGVGNGLVDLKELLQTTSKKVVTWERGTDNYATARVSEEFGFHRRPGSTNLYGDGFESSDAEEQFIRISRKTENWTKVGEGRFSLLTVVERVNQPLSVTVETVSEQPAVPRRSSVTPTLADFDGDATAFENALAADRFDQRQLKASCDLSFLETRRPRRDIVGQFVEWAEDADELASYCKRASLFQVGDQLQFTVLAHGRIEEGDWCHVYCPPGSGINAEGYVAEVAHSGGFPILSTVTLAVYPESLAVNVTVGEVA